MVQIPTLVVRSLLIACVAAFALQLWKWDLVIAYFALWNPETGLFRPWQLVTSAFLHGGWIHLLINCMVLYSFGPVLERLLGPGRFLTYFIVSAIGGAVLQVLAQIWGLSGAAYSLGASAGTSGLLLAFAMAYPRHKIVVFPIPVPLSAWICVAVFASASLVFALTGIAAGIGHFAHLGGMIGGLLLSLYWRARATR
jgi:membrane associated rhomboid family serine protease